MQGFFYQDLVKTKGCCVIPRKNLTNFRAYLGKTFQTLNNDDPNSKGACK